MTGSDPSFISSVPPTFDGTFSEFYSKHIEPNLPSPSSVLAIHNLLEAYVMDPRNNDFIARHFGRFKQAGFPFPIGDSVEEKYTLFCGDNEPALWFYARARLGDYPSRLPSVRHAIDNRSFPVSMVPDTRRSENKNDWKNWRKEDWERKEFSGHGWYHAHLFDAAKSLDPLALRREDLVMRMIRFLHPANHFPMPTHTGKRRRFASTAAGPRDMSEGMGIKAFILSKYKERYRECFSRFLELARGTEHDFGSTTGGAEFAYTEVRRAPNPSASAMGQGAHAELNDGRDASSSTEVEFKPESGDLVLRAYADSGQGYLNVWNEGRLEILNTHQTIRNVIRTYSDRSARPVFVINMSRPDKSIVSYGWLDEIVECVHPDGMTLFDVYFRDLVSCSFCGSAKQPPGYYYVD
ncbi:MAG: hypothetical protein U0610_33510 [bacterium]